MYSCPLQAYLTVRNCIRHDDTDPDLTGLYVMVTDDVAVEEKGKRFMDLMVQYIIARVRAKYAVDSVQVDTFIKK